MSSGKFKFGVRCCCGGACLECFDDYKLTGRLVVGSCSRTDSSGTWHSAIDVNNLWTADTGALTLFTNPTVSSHGIAVGATIAADSSVQHVIYIDDADVGYSSRNYGEFIRSGSVAYALLSKVGLTFIPSLSITYNADTGVISLGATVGSGNHLSFFALPLATPPNMRNSWGVGTFTVASLHKAIFRTTQIREQGITISSVACGAVTTCAAQFITEPVLSDTIELDLSGLSDVEIDPTDYPPGSDDNKHTLSELNGNYTLYGVPGDCSWYSDWFQTSADVGGAEANMVPDGGGVYREVLSRCNSDPSMRRYLWWMWEVGLRTLISGKVGYSVVLKSICMPRATPWDPNDVEFAVRRYSLSPDEGSRNEAVWEVQLREAADPKGSGVGTFTDDLLYDYDPYEGGDSAVTPGSDLTVNVHHGPGIPASYFGFSTQNPSISLTITEMGAI